MQNEHRLRKTAWNFLRPYNEGTIFYLLVTAGVVISAWINRLRVTETGFEVVRLVQESLRFSLDEISQFTSQSRALVFVFWFTIGSIVYILVWLIANVGIDLYNDIIISSAFVHPKSFKQSSFWGAIASRVLLRIAATLLLVLYGAFWIQVLLPIWLRSVSSFFNNPSDLTTAANGGIAIILCMLSLHIMAILYRFITLKAEASY